MKVIGLTGGAATGKSTVGRILSTDHGVPVIDADQVARQVVAPGTPALQKIRERFGDGVIDAAGALDRAALRACIVRDAAARRDLEAITHPQIRASIAEQLLRLAEGGASLAFVEAALLVETGSYKLYDGLWVVSVDPEIQLQRLIQRDHVSTGDARALLAAQLPMADKERVASRVLRNEGSPDDLRQVVADALAAERNAQ